MAKVKNSEKKIQISFGKILINKKVLCKVLLIKASFEWVMGNRIASADNLIQ